MLMLHKQNMVSIEERTRKKEVKGKSKTKFQFHHSGGVATDEFLNPLLREFPESSVWFCSGPTASDALPTEIH